MKYVKIKSLSINITRLNWKQALPNVVIWIALIGLLIWMIVR